MSPAECRVLIAEDDALLALFLTGVVKDAGMVSCGVARDIPSALRMMDSCHPAVALIDANLRGPDMGIELAREVKAAYGTSVILMSGAPDLAQRAALASVEVAGVLEKPFVDEQLLDMLQQIAATRAAA